LGRFDCRGILRTMSDYIDGDLGDAVCRDVEAHLATCRKCRFHVDAVRYTIRLYDDWRTDEMPADAVIRLRARLRDEAGCFEASPPEKSRAKPVRRKSGRKRAAPAKRTRRKGPAGRGK